MTGVGVALVAALSLGVGAALQPVVAQGMSYLTQTFRIGAATPYNLTWPADDGASDGILQTDGAGVLTWATDLDVAGGIEAGSGDVALVGTDGKINGPLSSTILDDLSGANLTALNGANLTTGTVGAAAIAANAVGASEIAANAVGSSELASGAVTLADVPDNVIVDQAFGTDSTYTTSATTTWVDTGLSLTITVNDATNDVVLMAWQHVSASGGNAGCQLRFVRGTTALTTLATGAGTDRFISMHIEEDANPGTGAHTYKTQLNRTGTVNTCYSEHGSRKSVLWAYEVQD